MQLQHTAYAVDDRVATVTLSRPERMNAFTYTMRDELIGVFEQVSRDDAVRAVVVTGAGKAFCAGADLGSGGDTFDRTTDGGLGEPGTAAAQGVNLATYRDGGGQVSMAIHACRKPVIAAINGHAVGVGITMTLPMDMRVVSSEAKVGFVFTRRGIVPEACSSWFLPRIVGIAKATELVMTGRVFRAEEEASSGLFNYVLPPDEVLPKAYALAREIADNTSATSVALSRALLWQGLGNADPQSTFLDDSRCMYWSGQQADAYEGVQSFLERRPPKFTLSAWTDMPDFYPWWRAPKV